MNSMVTKDSQKGSKARKRGEFFFGTNRPYLLAIVAAIILFILVAPVRVHGDNMAPLLNDGDIVIIAKSTYYDEKLPEYGDILCFKRSFVPASAKVDSADGAGDTDNTDGADSTNKAGDADSADHTDGVGSGDSERYYRFATVYGLPGDEMSVTDSELLRNGVKVCDLKEGAQEGSETELIGVSSNANNGIDVGSDSSSGIDSGSGTNADSNSGAGSLIANRKVGAGEVFVLNYYTNDTMDSRNSDVDAKLDEVRGKILFRIFPINMFGAVE